MTSIDAWIGSVHALVRSRLAGVISLTSPGGGSSAFTCADPGSIASRQAVRSHSFLMNH
ncbi:hypothetical protein [Kitasatospora sp. NPDC097691]|uniref:hypothetical protein n=1 Tax=Kitasatospora sp. NPDC097691 TaxID=3157231 RepID=UPI003327B015